MLEKRTLIKDTPSKKNEEVTLYGWVNKIRDHGKVGFIDLRDTSGIIQVVFYGQNYKYIKELGLEYVLKVVGKVKERNPNQYNEKILTGKIEIDLLEIEILNTSKELPIPLDTEGYNIEEETRLKYRYVDLRRERMHKNIITRSKLTNAIRSELIKRDFVEVETPMLTKSTKEGARDFIVPSRHHRGKFYALPQSPQQYKQLLMTAGVEKYFQIARCIRDEDLRADRGFEFTQVDLEMSFVSQEDVMKTTESVIKNALANFNVKFKEDKFPIFTYEEAMKQFGADKFDRRTEKEKKEGVLAFAWVIDFPFFKKVDKKDEAEKLDGKSGWTFTHNPFSMPQKEHVNWLLEGKNIDSIKAYQYDLVCNGYEVGGGSIRAHKRELLKATFRIMGYSDKEIEERVGHMLEAFELGTPPHGGIALGLDRLAMILTGEKNLKEVIPFPMTGRGKTAVMDAPSAVEKELLKELGIKIIKKDK